MRCTDWPESRTRLPHIRAERLGGIVGLEDRRQEAVRVQALNPLTIEAIGLGSALDLAGERGRGHDGGEVGFDEREVQHVAVDTAGFEGDGRDTAVSQPGDEVTEAGRVGGELARGGGAVGRGRDADPVGAVTDVDAGGVGVLHGQRIEFGRGFAESANATCGSAR